MKYHLKCDTLHDFSGVEGIANPIYGNVPDPAGAGGHNEAQARTFFLEHPGSASLFEVGDREKRLKSKQQFVLKDETAINRNTNVLTKLFVTGTGNENVGIVHDAGDFVYSALGAQNLLTFGSVLDQARKPIAADRLPVYFPAAGTVLNIPACEYGFDSNELQTITVQNFTGGGTVECVWTMGGSSGRQIDPVGLKPVGAVGSVTKKIINDTDPDTAGYFTSITNVKNIVVTQKAEVYDLVKGLHMSNFGGRRDGGKLTPEEERRYFMGKALGDMMLVASLQPIVGFTGGSVISNTFLPELTGGLTPERFNPAQPEPKAIHHCVLKTHDRLNHVRAIIKGVPSIYQQNVTTADPVQYFEFVPGEGGDNIDFYKNDLTTHIPNRIEKVYNDLIASFNGIVREQTNFTSMDGPIPIDRMPIATQIIREVVRCIENIKQGILAFAVSNRSKIVSDAAENVENIREPYKTFVSNLTSVLPLTTDVYNKKNQSLIDNIILFQSSRATPVTMNGKTYKTRYVIRLKESFDRLRQGTATDYASATKGAKKLEPFLKDFETEAKFTKVGSTEQLGGKVDVLRPTPDIAFLEKVSKTPLTEERVLLKEDEKQTKVESILQKVLEGTPDDLKQEFQEEYAWIVETYKSDKWDISGLPKRPYVEWVDPEPELLRFSMFVENLLGQTGGAQEELEQLKDVALLSQYTAETILTGILDFYSEDFISDKGLFIRICAQLGRSNPTLLGKEINDISVWRMSDDDVYNAIQVLNPPQSQKTIYSDLFNAFTYLTYARIVTDPIVEQDKDVVTITGYDDSRLSTLYGMVVRVFQTPPGGESVADLIQAIVSQFESRFEAKVSKLAARRPRAGMSVQARPSEQPLRIAVQDRAQRQREERLQQARRPPGGDGDIEMAGTNGGARYLPDLDLPPPIAGGRRSERRRTHRKRL